MRYASLLAVALAGGGCGDNAAGPDAGDPTDARDPTLVTVEVLGGCRGLQPCSQTVRIAGVEVALRDGVGAGPVPAGGGPVERHLVGCSSPTACVDMTAVVADARRGDTIRFGGDPAPLPADCVCRDIPAPVVDDTGVHWTDPGLATVAARYVWIATGTVPIPPFRMVSYTHVDGERSVDLARPDIPADAVVSVWVLECAATPYAALRTDAMRYPGC